MIIGNGSLAKLLKDREGAIFFCSGVTKKGIEPDEWQREIYILQSLVLSSGSLFYFSSIVKKGDYGIHKHFMECRVRDYFENYNIIRIGNIWECTNPNTFINYLKAHPEAEVRENEMKYMISAAQLNLICQSLPLTGKNEISVFGEMLTVKECLKR